MTQFVGIRSAKTGSQVHARLAHALWERGEEGFVIVFGVILLVMGLLLKIPILTVIGFVFALIGAVLWGLGAVGREVGGRRHYY